MQTKKDLKIDRFQKDKFSFKLIAGMSTTSESKQHDTVVSHNLFN